MNRPSSIPETEEGNNSGSGRLNSHNCDSDASPHKRMKLFNLTIKTISWPLEGRGLLHVQSPLLFCKDFRIRSAYGSYFLVRSENTIQIMPEIFGLQADTSELVARLDISESGILLDATSPLADDETDPSDFRRNEVWEEVPKDTQGREIHAGDTLRFGSYKVRVVEIVLDAAGTKSLSSAPSPSPLRPFVDVFDGAASEGVSVYSENASGPPICRICFDPASPEEPKNPLVSPCLCSGSLRYIHVDCLRRWLDGQLQVKQFENGGGSYFIRAVHCEICKSEYSPSIYRSILIPRPSVPHILLEDIIMLPHSEDPNRRPVSKMHIIPITVGKPVRLGRSRENDVVLSDISVSRVHGQISLSADGKSVWLRDLQSKFGSLVRLPSRIFHPAQSLHPLRVQIGPSLIEIEISFPPRVEKLVPERFLQHKGSVRVIKTYSPADGEKALRSRAGSSGSPLSPAATLDQSVLRSTPGEEEYVLHGSPDLPVRNSS